MRCGVHSRPAGNTDCRRRSRRPCFRPGLRAAGRCCRLRGRVCGLPASVAAAILLQQLEIWPQCASQASEHVDSALMLWIHPWHLRRSVRAASNSGLPSLSHESGAGPSPPWGAAATPLGTVRELLLQTSAGRGPSPAAPLQASAVRPTDPLRRSDLRFPQPPPAAARQCWRSGYRHAAACAPLWRQDQWRVHVPHAHRAAAALWQVGGLLQPLRHC